MLVVLERPSKYHKETKDTNYDNLWKKVIMDLFEDFLYFFLPAFHEQVDFSRPIEFIQQELFKEIIIDRKGRKMADQIAKVYLKNGQEQWVLVHTEVQAEDGDDFPLRMFEYYYRIFDRHQQKIIAIALFTDTGNEVNMYESAYFGTELTYKYNKYKITDFDEQQLLASPKLFSRALLAGLYMNQTKKDESLRKTYKRTLLRDVLARREVSRMEIRALLYFIDYLMKLSKEQTEKLTAEIRAEIREEDKEMVMQHRNDLPPIITGILELERQEWMKQGKEEGRKEGIEKGVEQAKVTTARNLLSLGIDDEVIIKATGLTLVQLNILRLNQNE